jgi:uncharacterized protein (DUF4415 family)
MTTKMVSYSIDLEDLPPLTGEQKTELKSLAAMPACEIDTSDIPPLDEKFWQNAVRHPFYKPTKRSTTVRIDADVLHWLKQQGRGYQSRINAILRREMLAALKQTEAK